MDPQLRAAPSRDSWRRRAMPPLWQYFARVSRKRQTSPSLPPKAADPGPLSPFLLQTRHFLGSGKGAMMRLMDPSTARISSAAARLAAVLGATAMPPLWQYFSCVWKEQTRPSLPPKGGESRTPGVFPCKPGKGQ